MATLKQLLDSLTQDLKFVFRTLGSDRWFSATVIGVLALGIGANTLGFTIVNAAFFRGLPFEQSARAAHGHAGSTNAAGASGPRPIELDAWRSESRTFAALAGYDDASASFSDDRALPDQVRATRVTTKTFAILRQPPVLGRDFVAADATAASEPVVILAHHVWKNRYGGDAAVLGRVSAHRRPRRPP